MRRHFEQAIEECLGNLIGVRRDLGKAVVYQCYLLRSHGGGYGTYTLDEAKKTITAKLENAAYAGALAQL